MSAPAQYVPSPTPDLAKIGRALISVSEKAGLVEFGRFLAGRGVEILSTGGSAKTLREAGVKVTEVSDHTGFPEIMDGRVKTLQPAIHGGILARRTDKTHAAEMAAHKITPIDLVVVNLYPFEATVARGADFATCVENIDIGGPALIRAAAKNHDFVTVVVDPADYAAVQAEMSAHNGATSLALRRKLAGAAFARTGSYDAAIAQWFGRQLDEPFPKRLAIGGTLVQTLRYGENPHQRAAFYSDGSNRPGIATARIVQGRELSYNNLSDTEAAYEAVAEFDQPAVVIVKHANPCGVATGPDLKTAWHRAFACDPVSPYGGIVAVNRPLDAALTEALAGIFLEVIIAPEATPEALEMIGKRRNLRLLLAGGLPDPDAPRMTFKSVAGGILLQSADNGRVAREALKVVTKRAPTERELDDLLFAFRVCKHVKSNAIVYAKDGATVGIGAGQMSRVDSSRIAAWKAEEAGKAAGLGESMAKGCVGASDAFFPFADGLLAIADAGATAVIQPGGSMRDAEVIAAADERGLAMVFTGMRHFRH
ncbi:MAG: bifunctional phosphoribosylaminoimidazolecarboxamide formyltransferase/IMP cyclohydrolase [Alphaproteobacteria bacterium]|nr:bifunctional phosphoribosylaminoimidazolecarboxamide formyltransferase/IMP cyclohydrolase [Alphaproteobacteria bacterium]